MDLMNIVTDVAKAKATFMGETLNFKYRPALITADAVDLLTSAQDVSTMGKFFAELIVSWDLTKAGEPVPVSAEQLMGLPLHLLRSISNAIIEDVPQGEGGKG